MAEIVIPVPDESYDGVIEALANQYCYAIGALVDETKEDYVLRHLTAMVTRVYTSAEVEKITAVARVTKTAEIEVAFKDVKIKKIDPTPIQEEEVIP